MSGNEQPDGAVPMSLSKQQLTPTPTPDLAAVKRRQQAVWASGDFSVIGTTLQIVGENLAEAVDLRASEHVLDVAAGNGNASLAAARRFAVVTSTDYVPALLDRGAARARAEGLRIRFQVADAESLPYPDASYDLALSTFGVMFAPDHARSAAELLRVVRSGGRIGLASWTPEGFIGRLFATVGRFVPAPAGVASPVLWGTEPHIVRLFGRQSLDIRCERKEFLMRYESPAHWLQVFREYYGPTQQAFATLDLQAQRELEIEITGLLEGMNIGGPGSLVVPAEYLQVVIVRQ
jgi:SAM-dependent methyltransferase